MNNSTGGKVTWIFDADTGKWEAALLRTRQQTKKTADELDKDIGGKSKAATDKASSGFARLGVAIGAVAAVASTVFSRAINSITNSVGAAISRVDTFNNSARTFANMGFATDQVNSSMKALEMSVRGLPTPLDSAIRGMTSLAATYGNIDAGQKVFTSLNNAILGFGGTTAMVENAILQLSQVPMDGPLDAQTWNSLRNSGLTPVLVAMAKDMGKSVSQMKADFGDGILTVEDFTNALVKMNTQGGGGMKSLEQIAKDSTAGIGTGIANAQTAIVRGVGKIIEAIGSANISGWIGDIGSRLEGLLTKFAGLVPSIISVTTSVINFTKALTPLIAGISALIAINWLSAALVTLRMGFIATTISTLGFSGALSALSVALKGLLLSIGPIGWAIIALGLAFTAYMNDLGGIRAKVQPVIDVFKSLWEVVRMLGTGDFRGGIFNLPEDDPIINRLLGIRETFVSVFNTIKSVVGEAIGFAQSTWDQFSGSLISIGNQLKTTFAPIFTEIGGAIKSIFKDISDAVKPVLDSIFGFFKDNKDVILTVLKAIGIAIGAIFAAPIVGAIGLFLGAFKLLAVALEFVAKNFETIKKVVIGVIAVALSPVILAVGLLVGAFLAVKKGIELVVAGFNIFVSGVTKVVSFLRSAGQAIWQVIYYPLNFLLNVFTIIFGSILLVVIYAVKAIWTAIVFYFNIIKDIVTSVLSFIWNVISTVWNAVYGVVSTVVQSIADFIVGVWNWIKDTTSTVFNAIKDFVSNIWNSIYETIKGIVTSIINFFAPAGSWLFDKGKAIVQGLVDGIKNIANAVWNAIKFVADQIGDFFKGAGTWLFDTGKNIILGLANGIGSAAKTVYDKADEIANGVKNKIKSALGIRSPSRVMMGYGVNTGEGFAIGLEKSMNGVFKDTFNDFDNQVKVQGSNQGSIVRGADIQATGSVVENHIGTINIDSEVDGENWLNRLTRQDEITRAGLIGVN